MTTTFNSEQLMGRTAVDAAGAKIGKIGQVYVDDRTGQPTWLTVSTGLFGTRESFAPLYGTDVSGDDVVLSVSKDQVKDAPNVAADGHVSDDEPNSLRRGALGAYGSPSTAA